VGREAVIRAGADRGALGDHAWFGGFAMLDDPLVVVVPSSRRPRRSPRARAAALRQALRNSAARAPQDVVAEIGN
jgi:hypothetical protein